MDEKRLKSMVSEFVESMTLGNGTSESVQRAFDGRGKIDFMQNLDYGIVGGCVSITKID